MIYNSRGFAALLDRDGFASVPANSHCDTDEPRQPWLGRPNRCRAQSWPLPDRAHRWRGPRSFQALRSDPIIDANSRVGVYTEHLDLDRFPSPQYRLQTRNYLREKYRDTRIGVVIVDGPIGLDLVLSWRGEMWPEVPVVFLALMN